MNSLNKWQLMPLIAFAFVLVIVLIAIILEWEFQTQESRTEDDLRKAGLDVTVSTNKSGTFNFETVQVIAIGLNTENFRGQIVNGYAQIESTNVTRVIEKCRSIAVLDLSSSDLGNATLARIVSNNPLINVDISNTLVDDGAIKQLAQCNTLTTLTLYESMVTDDGISRLKMCESLLELGVGGPSRRLRHDG